MTLADGRIGNVPPVSKHQITVISGLIMIERNRCEIKIDKFTGNAGFLISYINNRNIKIRMFTKCQNYYYMQHNYG